MPRLINAVPNGYVSWYGFSKAIISTLREQGFHIRTKEIRPVSSYSLKQTAKRPSNSRLSNQQLIKFTGRPMDNWDKFLQNLVLKAIPKIKPI